MKHARILVVEDEQIVALDLKNKLAHFGYQDTLSVSSGKDAIEKAVEFRPDLVLMDIMLEGPMDGVEAAAEIQRRLSAPVIFLTAFGDDTMIARATNLITGPLIRFVIKPFDEEALKTAVHSALERKNNG